MLVSAFFPFVFFVLFCFCFCFFFFVLFCFVLFFVRFFVAFCNFCLVLFGLLLFVCLFPFWLSLQLRQSKLVFYCSASEEVGIAQFKFATPTYTSVAYSILILTGNYRIIHKQNLSKIISKGTEVWILTNFLVRIILHIMIQDSIFFSSYVI